MTIEEMMNDIAELTAQHNQLAAQRDSAEQMRLKTLGAIEALQQLVDREEKAAKKAADRKAGEEMMDMALRRRPLESPHTKEELVAEADKLARKVAAEAISGETVS